MDVEFYSQCVDGLVRSHENETLPPPGRSRQRQSLLVFLEWMPRDDFLSQFHVSSLDEPDCLGHVVSALRKLALDRQALRHYGGIWYRHLVDNDARETASRQTSVSRSVFK